MLESLKDRLTQDVDSPDLRVIILRANGPVFSSGHNLKELVSLRNITCILMISSFFNFKLHLDSLFVVVLSNIRYFCHISVSVSCL